MGGEEEIKVGWGRMGLGGMGRHRCEACSLGERPGQVCVLEDDFVENGF